MPPDSHKLRPVAFANAIAVTTFALALFLLALRVLSPTLFTFFFNAQFFGADVNSLLPRPRSSLSSPAPGGSAISGPSSTTGGLNPD